MPSAERLPAVTGEVAFVDVAKVINYITPGKAGQKIVDDLRAKLNADFEAYSKTESDAQKVRQRQMSLTKYMRRNTRVWPALSHIVCAL